MGYSGGSWCSQLIRGEGSKLGPVDFAEVKGLVRLNPGVVFNGSLTCFDLESQLLWEYWGRPQSAYSLEVADSFQLAQPVGKRGWDC